jgi:hypothetical protein
MSGKRICSDEREDITAGFGISSVGRYSISHAFIPGSRVLF